MQRDQDFDIARNIKAIEWLKTEIVIDAGQIGRALLNGKDELVLESIADSILCCYLLARRLGVSFSKLESAVEGRARMAGMQGHELGSGTTTYPACRASQCPLHLMKLIYLSTQDLHYLGRVLLIYVAAILIGSQLGWLFVGLAAGLPALLIGSKHGTAAAIPVALICLRPSAG